MLVEVTERAIAHTGKKKFLLAGRRRQFEIATDAYDNVPKKGH